MQVLKTICAFANEIQNLNGGYIVLGIAAADGRAVFPPTGTRSECHRRHSALDQGRCNTLDPVYQPVMSPESIDDRNLLVIWAPGSEALIVIPASGVRSQGFQP